MKRSYRLGLTIVLVTFLVAAALAPLVPKRAFRPAAEDLSAAPKEIGPFRLTDESGRAVTDADLAGKVWVADFIFTRCPSSCPKLSAQMAALQKALAGTGVELVSLSVDPEHDTPPVLSAYAKRFGAIPGRWTFLTGPRDDVYRLILDQFQLYVERSSEEDRRQGAEAVSHSNRLVLLDRGNRIVGIYDSNDPDAMKALVSKAKPLDLGWVLRLPTVNATLNGSCAVLLVAAWLLVRSGRPKAHAAVMTVCLVVSALFLTCYLVYHYHVGSVPFRGQGSARTVYFAVLLSHTVLAVAAVPLIALTTVVPGPCDRSSSGTSVELPRSRFRSGSMSRSRALSFI